MPCTYLSTTRATYGFHCQQTCLNQQHTTFLPACLRYWHISCTPDHHVRKGRYSNGHSPCVVCNGWFLEQPQRMISLCIFVKLCHKGRTVQDFFQTTTYTEFRDRLEFKLAELHESTTRWDMYFKTTAFTLRANSLKFRLVRIYHKDV